MLLPRQTPELIGLELDARYTPAQRVGGDLYDFFQLSETQLGIAVADVSGKGIPASLLMAICRTNLRQIATRHTSPSRVLAELNQALSADIQSGLLSIQSPLAQAILGKEAGESVEVTTPRGLRYFEILTVGYS